MDAIGTESGTAASALVAREGASGRGSVAVERSPFALDVRFMTDTPPGHKLFACDSSDGCGTTCASACVTGEGF